MLGTINHQSRTLIITTHCQGRNDIVFYHSSQGTQFAYPCFQKRDILVPDLTEKWCSLIPEKTADLDRIPWFEIPDPGAVIPDPKLDPWSRPFDPWSQIPCYDPALYTTRTVNETLKKIFTPSAHVLTFVPYLKPRFEISLTNSRDFQTSSPGQLGRIRLWRSLVKNTAGNIDRCPHSWVLWPERTGREDSQCAGKPEVERIETQLACLQLVWPIGASRRQSGQGSERVGVPLHLYRWRDLEWLGAWCWTGCQIQCPGTHPCHRWPVVRSLRLHASTAGQFPSSRRHQVSVILHSECVCLLTVTWGS